MGGLSKQCTGLNRGFPQLPCVMQRFGRGILAAVLIAVACMPAESDPPIAAFGLFNPMEGGGATYPVSDKVGAPETERLYAILNSPAFRNELAQFNCGDPLPEVHFAVALYAAAPYRDRLVVFTPRPEIETSGRQRCLSMGLSFLWDRTVRALDRGEIVNPGYKHPDGRVITDDEYKLKPLSRPICDCSKRDLPGEWVTYPSERTP